MSATIRPARETDAAEMLARMRRTLAAGHPYLVAERDGEVLGYAHAGSYRGRAACQWTVENSVYVANAAHGLGIGTLLMRALIDACEACGFRQMVAVIGESAHAASIGLHEKLGFTLIDVFPALAFKHGRWLDTVQMQRALGPAADTPPSGLEPLR